MLVSGESIVFLLNALVVNWSANPGREDSRCGRGGNTAKVKNGVKEREKREAKEATAKEERPGIKKDGESTCLSVQEGAAPLMHDMAPVEWTVADAEEGARQGGERRWALCTCRYSMRKLIEEGSGGAGSSGLRQVHQRSDEQALSDAVAVRVQAATKRGAKRFVLHRA